MDVCIIDNVGGNDKEIVAAKTVDEILLVVNVGSLEKRSNQLKC